MFDDLSGMLGNFSGTIGELSGDVSQASQQIKQAYQGVQGDIQNIESNAMDVYGSIADYTNSILGPNSLPTLNTSRAGPQPRIAPNGNGNTLEIPQVYTGGSPDTSAVDASAPSPAATPNPSGSFYPSSAPSLNNRFPTGYPKYGDTNPPAASLTPAFWDSYNQGTFAGTSGTLVLGLLVLILVVVAVKAA